MKLAKILFILLLLSGDLSRGESNPTKSLSFETAVQTIVARDPSVERARAFANSVEGRNTADRFSYFPSISLNGEYERGKYSISGQEQTTRGINASASFNIFKFGADRAAVRRADAQEQAQEANWQSSILVSEKNAVVLLGRYLSRYYEQRLEKERFESRAMIFKIAGQRYRKGLLAKQEVHKAQIEHDNALASLREAEASFIEAKNTLLEALGHTSVELNWPWQKEISKANIASFKLQDVRSRPDWVAARMSVEAAEQEKNEQRGKMWPSLDLTGSYGFLQNRTLGTEGSTWQAGLTLSIPLFDRLSRYGNYKEAAELKTVAEKDFERLKRAARAEWQSSQRNLLIAIETARARKKTLALARSLFETNIKRFRSGRISVNDLVQDQERLFDAERLSIRGWETAHTTLVDFCRVRGKRINECLSIIKLHPGS